MGKLLTVGLLVLASLQAHAVDRVQLIQSKLQMSLSSILPRTDYIVIVNRLDTLDDGGASQTIDGTFRSLPGLQLGVDSRGEILRQDHSSGSYAGAVAIHVVIESKVKAETYKTIQKLLPEIIGGLRDDDELKLAQGPLRQPSIPGENASPNITIQNNSEPKSQTQENIKFLALLLLTGGLFFWFLARIKGPGANQNQNSGAGPGRADEAKASAQAAVGDIGPSDFAILDAEAVALFLLKAVKEKNEEFWLAWVKCVPAAHQRDVFKSMPAWVLSCLKEIQAKPKAEGEGETKVAISLREMFNEMALVEQSFKTDQQKKKAFLQWFPPQALRFVPRRFQSEFSDASKKTLWALRPDLGDFLKLESMNVEDVMREQSAAEIEKCVMELYALPSTSIDGQGERGGDLVKRWIELINQLVEFSPIESQLEQARARLDGGQFERVLHSVAHLRSPFHFFESVRKDWLRAVQPDDYFYWVFLAKEEPSWSLREELRPMRWAMFNQAGQEKAYLGWSEDERKLAAKRLLQGFRHHSLEYRPSLTNEAA